MHSEACSGQLPDVPGHGAEGEADPPDAVVLVLLEAPDGQGVLDNGQVAQLHH
jgi:hypothetical protein